PRPDKILFDLGISTYHYEKSGRGFSFRKEEPLSLELGGDLVVSAADMVNNYPAERLADIIYNYGEERYSRRIAKAIVEARASEPITTAAQLADVVYHAVPEGYRHGKIHPATRTFQALRIAVNGELERLGEALDKALEVLAPGGRIGVITFHSLEDRIVKNFFRDKEKDCICPDSAPRCTCGRNHRKVNIITKKPVVPSDAEIAENAASRSSKLRVAEKVAV
ncbi:MAG: 16S rRNA (cytosine(1402)-N(4))-methyltransferase RsmH, partial [Spirochaetales bacterium]|nr:16S rRNA (cytosine(1402)-N(4))-methyltransferase RsmH [Spirochaetales bacterium]